MYESGNELVLEEKEWHDRGQFAAILMDLIIAQHKLYKKTRDTMKKNKLAHSTAYLIQVMSSLINSEKNLDERISRLEEIAKLR